MRPPKDKHVGFLVEKGDNTNEWRAKFNKNLPRRPPASILRTPRRSPRAASKSANRNVAFAVKIPQVGP